MTRAEINTNFGLISFEFEDELSLTNSLEQFPDQIKKIGSKVRMFLPRPIRDPKPGYESAYRFTPNGQVELLYFPPEGVRCVALALYAFHPDMVSAIELELVTGIPEVSGKVLGQTMNKKYFRRNEDIFGLSAEGIAYVNEVIYPLLPKISQSPNEVE
jgi:hypothetical protein